MARPRKEGMDYFPHDTDAVSDEKIEALRLLYGNDGYAFYFILLERIYRTSNFELDISDAETIQILARKVAVTEEKFNQMLETALKRGLFDKTAYHERGVLTSEGIKKRANVVVEKRLKMREKYQNEKLSTNSETSIISDAEITEETTEESTQSKEKKSKQKKNNNNISSRRKSKIYDQQSVYYQLALRLFNKIRENNPSFKEPDLQKWADDVRLMIERDNRTEQQVAYLIDWCQQDSFWRANILSPAKLRKQFDRLVMQIKSEKEKINKPKKIAKIIHIARPSHLPEPQVTEEEKQGLNQLLEDEMLI
jgi:hypothetical protein